MKRILFVAALSLLTAGCLEEEVVEKPVAIVMSAEALGYYCQMNVLEHDGPRAQIHLAGMPAPIWFSQIRDAVAYTRLPEETAEVVAIYVNDMGKAKSWTDPGEDNWVDADFAFFVIGSSKTGGMGAPEAVPFGSENDALAFAQDNGGEVVRLPAIPDDYVLSPIDTASIPGTGDIVSD